VFVPGEPFKPGLIFVIKARACPSGARFRHSSRAGFWPRPQILKLAGKSFQGKTL